MEGKGRRGEEQRGRKKERVSERRDRREREEVRRDRSCLFERERKAGGVGVACLLKGQSSPLQLCPL